MKNIIRIEKREKFTIIARALLEDKRLHWATRGILGYLLSKPDNWVLQVNDLKKQGDLGRDAIYKRIKNAIEIGYIVRIDHRDDRGRRTGVEYIVHEKPVIPLTENQDVVNPVTENTDNNKDTVLTNTKRTTTTNNHVCGSYKFHKKLTNLQKTEILKLFNSVDSEVAQDILFELSGFIDKNLIKKDAVSLTQGFIRKAQQGEFCLRLGIKYKESNNSEQQFKEANEISIESIPQLLPEHIDNSLVKKIMNIKKRSG